MGAWAAYRLRIERKRWLIRAFRKRRQLAAFEDRTNEIHAGDVLLASCMWNERARLPHFLRYYRRMGVGHFLIVDNNSDDGTAEYLAGQPDVSVWRATGSYRRARYGMDWINWILRKHARGHWVATVDADEFLVYPFSDTRPLAALTECLTRSGAESFPAMLLDVYPRGPVNHAHVDEGQDPLEVAEWFDGGNYTYSRNPKYGNLWIQGGPRARMFFSHNPRHAPSLNKIPLVRWQRGFVYVQSTHMLLPRRLNATFDAGPGEAISGCLLHAKLISDLAGKAEAEQKRGEHFAGGREYRAYGEGLQNGPDFWHEWSERYINWRQLETIGLMSKGNWA